MNAMDSQPAITTEDQPVEILLVEDNPNDVQLTLHALKRHRLTNRIHVVRDGAEALEFLFGTGAYGERYGKSQAGDARPETSAGGREGGTAGDAG